MTTLNQFSMLFLLENIVLQCFWHNLKPCCISQSVRFDLIRLVQIVLICRIFTQICPGLDQLSDEF